MADDGGAREACIVVVGAGGYQLGYEMNGAYLLRRLRWLLAFCSVHYGQGGYFINGHLKLMFDISQFYISMASMLILS